MATTPDNRRKPYSNELLAAAPIIAEKCAEQNIAFMECKKEHEKEHPRVCLEQAHKVEDCVFSTDVKKACPVEFKNFTDCLYSYNNRYEDCRKAQLAFMKCWESASH
ncbi:hypothetical protein WA158_004940 [Blastocystis sp. Blastoise]